MISVNWASDFVQIFDHTIYFEPVPERRCERCGKHSNFRVTADKLKVSEFLCQKCAHLLIHMAGNNAKVLRGFATNELRGKDDSGD